MCAETRDAAARRGDDRETPDSSAMTTAKLPNDITSDLVAIGQRIGAVGLIVSYGDDDGYEEFLATHWSHPDDAE